MHRPVWDPGHKERRDALHAVERRIAELLSTLAPRHLLDLGCGTGASALWLAERLPARITGVTLSALQARLAMEQAAARGLAGRCRFLEADFLALPDPEPVDAAYAIESFTHVESPGAFFTALRSRLLPGGLLILCDDFLEHSPSQSGEEARWVERFRTGWRLSSLSTLTEVRRQAEAQGFRLQHAEDLSPYLRLTPPPVLALRRLLPLLTLLSASARASLDGGTALQVCLHRGWVRYRFLVFRRGAA
jgi:cyclopropane fatty-acyl-phospholipid synthase-like methyltransferase